MLSGGNQTDGNSLKIFLTPFQHFSLPLSIHSLLHVSIKNKPSPCYDLYEMEMQNEIKHFIYVLGRF